MILSLLVLLIGCGPADGEAPCEPAVQDAIDASEDGDVVTICDGTYPEQLTIAGRRITLRSANGAEGATIDVSGAGTGLTISDGADVTVEGFTFANGVSAGDGGNISCADSSITLSGSTLEGGVAARGGGFAAQDCTVDLRDNQFVSNDAMGDEGGGGAWLSGCDGAVFSNGFDTNRAYLGAGLLVSGDEITIEANLFVSNAGGSGAGLYVRGASPIVGNTVEQNTATGNGGGVYVADHDGTIAGNTWQDNAAGDDGGGLYVEGGSPVVDGNGFDGNHASDDAGALRLKLSAATVTDNVFTSNTAGNRGGAGKFSHEAATVSGNTFTGNSATHEGGALVLEESASTLTHDTFTDNRSNDGGGLFVTAGWDPVVVEDCTFDANRAERFGGNLHVALPGVRVTLRRVEVTLGTASWGGGLYASGSDLELVNVLFHENAATVTGGGLHLEGSTVAVTNAVVWGNEAPEGSALSAVDGVATRVTNSVIGGHGPGEAVRIDAGAGPIWRYNDVFDNDSDFVGMADPVGTEGNVALEPGFADPDFHLGANSLLRDAGDPAISDPDGSRSDLGRYGGPSAL